MDEAEEVTGQVVLTPSDERGLVMIVGIFTVTALFRMNRRLRKMHNTLGLLTAMASANNFQLHELEQSQIDARTLLELLGNTKGPQ